MDRRRFLTTAGVVLVAGCQSTATTEQSPTPENETETNDSVASPSPTTGTERSSPIAVSPTPTNRQAPPPRELTDVSVTGLETSQFSVAVEIERSAITPEQTARFALTITSHTEESRFGFSNCIPFACATDSDPRGLLVLPYDGWYGRSNPHREPIDRKTEQTWVPAPDEIITGPDVMKGKFLGDGDSLTRRWELWGDPDHVSYIEPGTYQIRAVTSTDENFEWYCTITIEQT
jgi:hypothetical protein